jgi:hypothetical protein
VTRRDSPAGAVDGGVSERERDSAESWVLPKRARPPLLGELVERIDEALATARASEAAVMTVGAAALDAAEQAKRAAELAEQASRAMSGVEKRSAPTPGDRMDDFTARADRVAERLQGLQRVPLSA